MNKGKGFTMMEILVTILILGIISGFVFVQMKGAQESAQDTKRKADVNVIKNALIQYRSENYNVGPIQSSFCEIGENCTNFDPILGSFFGSAPKDPDGTSYLYQSVDGTDCAIIAILSDGSAYKYDCSEDTFSSETVINGGCGISTAYELTEGSSGLCSTGTMNSFSGSGPWGWNCSGANGGSDATCVATVAVSDLACSVVPGGCGGAIILKIASGHAEKPSQSNYSYQVCCTGTGISNDCSASHTAVALKLSGETNAHVEKNTFNNYSSSNDVCLSSTSDNVTCSYAADCSTLGGGYVCLASINSETNAHVSDCTSYSTKVCCRIH